MANLSKGAKGKPVALLQKALNKKGAKPKLKEDSSFGPLTDAAVRSYQKKKKMKADGVVGPLTGFSLGISPRPKSLDWPVTEFEKVHKYFNEVDDEVDNQMHQYLAKLKTAIAESNEVKKALVERAKMMNARHTKLFHFFKAKFALSDQLRALKKASASSSNMDEILKIHEKAEALYKELTNKDHVKAQTVWENFFGTVKDIDEYEEGVKALKSKLAK